MLVRATVPRTPFIVGAAVPCPVHACGDSLEVDVDVAASPVGDRFYRHVVHRLAGAVTVHVALLLEGQRPGELPEHLLGCARLARVAPGLAVPLPAG